LAKKKEKGQNDAEVSGQRFAGKMDMVVKCVCVVGAGGADECRADKCGSNPGLKREIRGTREGDGI